MKYLFLVLFSFSAMATDYQCPPELKTDQNSVDAPKGWKVYEEKFNSRHMLTNVEFYTGHPDDGVILAPGTDGNKNTWVFPKKDTITILCRYSSTLLTLTQELKKIERCEVIYEKEKPKSINCR